MPDAGPPEPVELLEIRNVSILTSDPETWAIELEFPPWMTPYEAHGMIIAAEKKLRLQIEELNAEEEEEEEDK